MDPFLHLDDIDLDPGLARLSMIVAVAGAVCFAFQFWRIKRRREKPPPNPG
jgi:hypothetical protein